MSDWIADAEPNALLRKLREHDLTGLRCLVHCAPPQVSITTTGLKISVCCAALAMAVEHVLGTRPSSTPSP